MLNATGTLVAATLTGARVLGLEHALGTLEPGKLASFVVLEDNPLDDIRAIRRRFLARLSNWNTRPNGSRR